MIDEYKKLNPKCKTAMYIGYIILMIILVIILYVIKWSVNYFYDNDNIIDAVQLFTMVVLSIALIYVIIAPVVFYRRYRYIITSDKVDIRRGIIIVRHTVVPIERIHQVEVVRGPINNMFGLANVDITTAGGMAQIEFLEVAEADRVADELNAYVTHILKDRQ